MGILRSKFCSLATLSFLSIGIMLASPLYGQGPNGSSNEAEAEFGPVMRAYLGYLRNEQEVVDDRASRREITTAYYRRNSNRIRALRQAAIRLVQDSGNDYLPELEAVAPDELKTLFEYPPRLSNVQTNQVLENKLRYLGPVHAGETFYVFARLDPYEQADLMQKEKHDSQRPVVNETQAIRSPAGQRVGQSPTRPRRVIPQID
jgi:hypothetical protein